MLPASLWIPTIKQAKMTSVQFQNSQRALATFGRFNQSGETRERKSHDNVYCGRRMNECICGHCDGVCGPSNGCPCASCRDLSKSIRTQRIILLKDKERTEYRVPVHTHPLVADRSDNGWACDGRKLPGGCRKGCTGFNQTTGWLRFRCARCDFDLCTACLEAHGVEIHACNSSGSLIKRGGNSTSFGLSFDGISLPCHQVFYCGERKNQCRCGQCDGRCGPTNGCPCDSCMSFTIDFYRSLLREVGPVASSVSVPIGAQVRVATHQHQLTRVDRDNGWMCSGATEPGGCKKGCTGFHMTYGWERYRCVECDFDYCLDCVAANAVAAATSSHSAATAGSTHPAHVAVRAPPPPERVTLSLGPALTSDGISGMSPSSVQNGEEMPITICVIGPSKSGKSALVHRYRTGQAPSPTASLTSDVESFATQWNDGRAVHRFQFRDIGGRPFLRHLRQPNYEVADGALCVFDATSEESFNELQGMVAEFRRMAKPGAVMVIAANKCDGATSSTLFQRVEQWRVGLEPLGSVRLCRTSATTGSGVQTAFSLVQERAVANRGASSMGSTAPNAAAATSGDNVNAGKQSDRVVAQLRSELTAAQQRIRELEDELQRLKGAKPLQSWEEAQSVETQLQEALTSVSRQKAQLWTRAREGTACVVCQTVEKTVLLLPCKHLCLCEGCSPAVRNCPMCRSTITSRMNIFA